MRRPLLFAWTLTLLLPLVCQAEDLPRGDAASVHIDAAALEDASAQLKAEVESKMIAGGMHMVLRHGKVVHFAIEGVGDIEDKRPLKSDSILRIYSMSKPITSLAAMQLWEQGAFKLDDPVANYIPSFRQTQVLVVDGEEHKMVDTERPIIVRDLLRHTAGYTYGRGMPEAYFQHYEKSGMLYSNRGMFPPEMSIACGAEVLARIPLLHQPGARFTYGLNVDLLGRLIEIWSGTTLDAYFQLAVFEPLGMIDTGFYVPADKADRFVSCHGMEEGTMIVVDKAEKSPYLAKPQFLSGGGGLVSTMEDYARFCQALVNLGQLDGVRVLDESTVRLMFTNQLAPATGSMRFGLGFAIQEVPLGTGDHERKALGYRWGGYANTAFQVIPSEGMAQIFMRQLIPSDHRVSKKLFPLVYKGTR
jgi:CubicO group peptidase (beta-lactamase class C family)